MASPQVENGYLKIANELVKELAKTYISGREWQILWHILRKTWCWEKKADWITLQQFSQATGIHRKECFTYLKRLEKRNIVLTHWDKNKKTYGFNKDYSSWQLSQPIRTCPNPVGRLSQPIRTDCPNPLGTTIKPLTKEPLTKETPIVPTKNEEEIYKYYSTHVRAGAKTDTIKHIKRLLKSNTKENILKWIDNYVKSVNFKNEIEYRIQGNNFFGKAERYKDFLTPIKKTDADPEWIKELVEAFKPKEPDWKAITEKAAEDLKNAEHSEPN